MIGDTWPIVGIVVSTTSVTAVFSWLVLRLPFAFDVTTPVGYLIPSGYFLVFNAACTLKCCLKFPPAQLFFSTVPPLPTRPIHLCRVNYILSHSHVFPQNRIRQL